MIRGFYGAEDEGALVCCVKEDHLPGLGSCLCRVAASVGRHLQPPSGRSSLRKSPVECSTAWPDLRLAGHDAHRGGELETGLKGVGSSAG